MSFRHSYVLRANETSDNRGDLPQPSFAFICFQILPLPSVAKTVPLFMISSSIQEHKWCPFLPFKLFPLQTHFFFKKYLFYVCQYTVAVSRHTRRGRPITDGCEPPLEEFSTTDPSLQAKFFILLKLNLSFPLYIYVQVFNVFFPHLLLSPDLNI